DKISSKQHQEFRIHARAEFGVDKIRENCCGGKPRRRLQAPAAVSKSGSSQTIVRITPIGFSNAVGFIHPLASTSPDLPILVGMNDIALIGPLLQTNQAHNHN